MIVRLAAVMLMLIALPAIAQEPIRIGFLTILTGPLAAPGKEMENGITLFLDEQKQTLGGRPVQLTVLDSGGTPAGTLAKARELVEQRKVHVIIGPLAAFEAYAIAPYVNAQKVPTISPSAAADDLTQRKATPFFVRATSSSSQPTQPFGTYAAKTLGYKKIATIADDFAFGHEVVAGFHQAFEDAGGEIVQKLWPPLGAADQSPYIGQLRRDIDAVFIGFAGVASLRFLKQFEDAGLKGKIPVLANQTATDEALLRNMGDEAVGVVSAMNYSAALDLAPNRKFVAAYRKAFGSDPGYYSVGAYTGRHRHVPEGSARRCDSRRAGWSDPAGQVRAARAQHLHPPCRAEGRPASEHRDPDDRERESVLDVPGAGLPEGAALFANVSSVSALLR